MPKGVYARSEETKQKMKNRVVTKETRKKQSEAHIRRQATCGCACCRTKRGEYKRTKEHTNNQQASFLRHFQEDEVFRKKHEDDLRKAGHIGGKRANEIMKRRNPEKYYSDRHCAAILGGKATQKILEKRPDYQDLKRRRSLNGGIKASEINRKNKPYYWRGVAFDSNYERQIAQTILKEPAEGINCHVKVGNKIVDFSPKEDDKMFCGHLVEYHPWDRELTHEQYYHNRVKDIGNPNLILITGHTKTVLKIFKPEDKQIVMVNIEQPVV
jgi:hypothetical protein